MWNKTRKKIQEMGGCKLERKQEGEISSEVCVLIAFIFCIFICDNDVCAGLPVFVQQKVCKTVPVSHLSVFILMPADRHQLSNSPTRD